MDAVKTVDFYFDFSSTNSYFAAFLLPAVCARTGARVNWMPLHLGALFRTTGFDVMALPPPKARALWRDHQRYAQWTGLPFRRPSRFPIKTSLALRAALAAGRIGADGSAAQRADTGSQAIADFSQGVFRAYWERDEDIADARVLRQVAVDTRLDADRIIGLASEQSVRDELAAIVQRAEQRGVFGAPIFVVGDELFWGKDRLDFVERWLRR